MQSSQSTNKNALNVTLTISIGPKKIWNYLSLITALKVTLQMNSVVLTLLAQMQLALRYASLSAKSKQLSILC